MQKMTAIWTPGGDKRQMDEINILLRSDIFIVFMLTVFHGPNSALYCKRRAK